MKHLRKYAVSVLNGICHRNINIYFKLTSTHILFKHSKAYTVAPSKDQFILRVLLSFALANNSAQQLFKIFKNLGPPAYLVVLVLMVIIWMNTHVNV